MWVEAAPDPEEVFWRNVGLPAKARRSGRLLSTVATSILCFFWSIPVAFFSSMTEINSLKEKLPLLAQWVEAFPALESLLALLAPLLLLTINEAVLPVVLKVCRAFGCTIHFYRANILVVVRNMGGTRGSVITRSITFRQTVCICGKSKCQTTMYFWKRLHLTIMC